ncbi:NtaA/DmoA family FMN-dependent monooxygenase [Paenibacillus sp. GCM10012307]|uniref:NtaA/DmoA family FMN-dependent monooxygenase n=1 Tax=Paenibacillus roseus TaxID=2798579 RepID=A0A934J6S6_9BACL|nr:NtaA/DmoA family FMN-dependent monooxygenase [Paenibacillus roseus]MBJ6361791.1 NtaA/DmoA family FMN-dependent monooxygenase [Paenibacillus roseus]
MKKQIHLNAFEVNGPGHLNDELWAHPEDERTRYKDLSYWLELAQLLEHGKFDAIFLDDVFGVYDPDGQESDPASHNSGQLPANDPMPVIAAMATVTQHLGFALTASTTYEQPFSFARRISTLDHLTKGRLAWNIVTSTLHSTANNPGLDQPLGRNDQHELGEEFLKVCYKLWELSWQDDAVVKDWGNRLYADPDKVHFIHHKGAHFNVAGPHLSEPSPQRTPVLFQSGTSTLGREFAAKHAEGIFIVGNQPDTIRLDVEEIRRKAAAFGRKPEHVKLFGQLTVVTGRTREEAERKFVNYSPGYYDSSGLLIVGDPLEVADQMEQWIAETGLDGFNLTQIVSPGTLRDFVKLVVPELQRRGIYRQEYEPPYTHTLRQRLFGEQHGKLSQDHPVLNLIRRERSHDIIHQ